MCKFYIRLKCEAAVADIDDLRCSPREKWRIADLDGYSCRMADELPHRFIGAQMSDRLLQQDSSNVSCQQTTSTSCKSRCIQYSAKFCLLSILDISDFASGQVFRPNWRDYPSVFARLIYRDRRRWKGRIGKRSYR